MYVEVEVKVEDKDEDVEVEDKDKDMEDEDVVAKVDQDRIKGALVVDSKVPLVDVGVNKDVLDMALQVDETSTLLIEPTFRTCNYLVLHVIVDSISQSHVCFLYCMMGHFCMVQNFVIFVDNWTATKIHYSAIYTS